MEMNEILNDLSSRDFNSEFNSDCGRRDDCGFGCGFGNGFGSWIWILLILFYSSSGNRVNRCCCDRGMKNDCCCNGGYGVGGYGNVGACGSMVGYLFLLVILFLCNGCGENRFGNENIFSGSC